jgi:hypothetical protein
VARDVVDVLLGIGGGDLPTELLEALDDPDGGVTVPRVVRRREPHGARAENGDVTDVSCFGHAIDANREPTLIRAGPSTLVD